MITAVFILQLLLVGGLGWHFWQQRQNVYSFDIVKLGENYADNLLSDYVNSIDTLELEATQHYIRTKYLQDAMFFGLPTSAAQKVADLVWDRVAEAQSDIYGDAPGARGFSFYD